MGFLGDVRMRISPAWHRSSRVVRDGLSLRNIAAGMMNPIVENASAPVRPSKSRIVQVIRGKSRYVKVSPGKSR